MKDVVYEKDIYHVVKVTKGYEIYKFESCVSVRCARCGYEGQKGLDWCKREIERRLNK